MKLVIRTVVFHMLCIIVFAFVYLYLAESFDDKSTEHPDIKKNNYKAAIDFLLLSTSVQSGVGISSIYPIQYYGKIAVIIQQLGVIMTHVISLYIFTL